MPPATYRPAGRPAIAGIDDILELIAFLASLGLTFDQLHNARWANMYYGQYQDCLQDFRRYALDMKARWRQARTMCDNLRKLGAATRKALQDLKRERRDKDHCIFDVEALLPTIDKLGDRACEVADAFGKAYMCMSDHLDVTQYVIENPTPEEGRRRPGDLPGMCQERLRTAVSKCIAPTADAYSMWTKLKEALLGLLKEMWNVFWVECEQQRIPSDDVPGILPTRPNPWRGQLNTAQDHWSVARHKRRQDIIGQI